MTRKSKFISTALLIITLTLMFACGQKPKTMTIDMPTVTNFEKVETFKIDTFSTFPAEIDGCSCYFSNDSTEFKQGKYIYMNDYAEISFMKINGILTKFKQTEFKKVSKSTIIAKFKSDNYEITIEVVDGKQSGEETTLKTGTIKVTDKNGKTVTKNFYGECGC